MQPGEAEIREALAGISHEPRLIACHARRRSLHARSSRLDAGTVPEAQTLCLWSLTAGQSRSMPFKYLSRKSNFRATKLLGARSKLLSDGRTAHNIADSDA